MDLICSLRAFLLNSILMWIIVLCEVSSGFCLPIIIIIGSFLTGVIYRRYKWHLFFETHALLIMMKLYQLYANRCRLVEEIRSECSGLKIEPDSVYMATVFSEFIQTMVLVSRGISLKPSFTYHAVSMPSSACMCVSVISLVVQIEEWVRSVSLCVCGQLLLYWGQ